MTRNERMEMGRPDRGLPPVLFVLAVLPALAALPATAAAAGPGEEKKPMVVEGTVVQLEDNELVVDLGREQGLPGDAVVQLYRRLEVTHPLTKKVLVDRFPLGKIRLSEVGSLLSIARNIEGLSRPPKAGDFVVFEPRPVQPVARLEPAGGVGAGTASAPATTPAIAVVPPRDPALAVIESAFASTLGRPLTDRIAVWEEYLATFPHGPYLDQVGKELDWLRGELAAERQAIETPQPPQEPVKLKSYFSMPSIVERGEPVEWTIAIAERHLVEAVRVMARRSGEPAYDTIPLARDGDFHWRAGLPQRFREPGSVEYFVEAVRTNGKLELLVGDSSRPRTLALEEPVRDAADDKNRSRATVIAEFVDFKSGAGQDEYYRIESDFRYQVGAGALNSFRVGVGRFAGQGASLGALQQGLPSETLSVNYGYAELELGLGSLVGLSGRLTAGSFKQVRDEGLLADEPTANLFGFRTELRIGEEQGTHLTIGGALTEQLGNEAWTELTMSVFRRLPMSAAVVVTNLPVDEDLGVSLCYGLGWQATDWLALSLRTGWNARTINHYGFTGGFGAVLTW